MAELNVGGDQLHAEQPVNVTRSYKFNLDQVLPEGDKILTCLWATQAGDGMKIVLMSKTDYTASLQITGGRPGKWHILTATWTSEQGVSDQFIFMVFATAPAQMVPVLGTPLFPNRFRATEQLRRDRLLAMARGALPAVDVSDDYLWDKLRAAEAEMAHTLRVPLTPTRFFPTEPTPEQVAELDGMPWAVEGAYDYEPEMFNGQKWGFIVTRQRPIQRIVSLKIAYPKPSNTVLDAPQDWIRFDARVGHVNIVPSGPLHTLPSFSGVILGAMSGGQRLPFALHLDYVAGLPNVEGDFPDLVDAVYKLASLKVLEDRFLPQSGSISADGLSQSLSMDTAKHREVIDSIINGPGGNGGLVAKIHGIRTMVM